MDPSDGAETGYTMSKKKPRSRATPDRARAPKAATVGKDAKEGENARQAANHLAFESDPHWELARSKPQGDLLLNAARMLDQMKKLVDSGFEALNAINPTSLEKVEIEQATKVAKQVRGTIDGWNDGWTHPAVPKVFAFIQDIEPYVVVDAWLKCLKLLKEKRQGTSRTASVDDVKALAMVLIDTDSDEHPAPCLARRMRLEAAIRNATACGINLATILNARNRNDIDRKGNYSPMQPRDKAFELARWALKGHNVNADSAFTIKKAYERMQRLSKEYSDDGTPRRARASSQK